MESLHQAAVRVVDDELEHEAIPTQIGNEHWDVLKWRRVPGPHPEMGILAGDIVHNVHSALDQLIYVLARERGHDPGSDSHFPIHHDENAWTHEVFPTGQKCSLCGAGVRKSPLAGLNDLQIAFISDRQPYRLPQKNRSGHPLAQLSRLSRIDKHRTLHVCAVRTDSPRISYVPDGHYAISKRKLTSDPLARQGAEFARIRRRVISAPRPDVQVQVKVEAQAHLAFLGPKDDVACTLRDLDVAIAFANDIVLALGPDSPVREVFPDDGLQSPT